MAPKRKAEAVNGASASASKTVKAAGNQATDASWLKPGDPCPDFKAITNDKEDFSLHENVKEKGAVIFIYPKANTPGCTKQARGFRDNFEDIQRAGYQVFGLSADNAGPQTNWRNKEKLPFTLLSDRNKSQLRELGFLAGDKIMRGHIVVGKRGVVQQYCAGVKPLDSVSSATDFCLQKGQEGDSDEGEGETG